MRETKKRVEAARRARPAARRRRVCRIARVRPPVTRALGLDSRRPRSAHALLCSDRCAAALRGRTLALRRFPPVLGEPAPALGALMSALGGLAAALGVRPRLHGRLTRWLRACTRALGACTTALNRTPLALGGLTTTLARCTAALGGFTRGLRRLTPARGELTRAFRIHAGALRATATGLAGGARGGEEVSPARFFPKTGTARPAAFVVTP